MNKLLALIAATAFATGAMAQTATTPATAAATMPKPTPVVTAPAAPVATTGQQMAPKAQVNADTKVAAKADAPVVKAQAKPAKPAKKAGKKKSKKMAPKKTT